MSGRIRSTDTLIKSPANNSILQYHHGANWNLIGSECPSRLGHRFAHVDEMAMPGKSRHESSKRFNSIRFSSHSPKPKAPAISICSGCRRRKVLY